MPRFSQGIRQPAWQKFSAESVPYLFSALPPLIPERSFLFLHHKRQLYREIFLLFLPNNGLYCSSHPHLHFQIYKLFLELKLPDFLFLQNFHKPLCTVSVSKSTCTNPMLIDLGNRLQNIIPFFIHMLYIRT